MSKEQIKAKFKNINPVEIDKIWKRSGGDLSKAIRLAKAFNDLLEGNRDDVDDALDFNKK